MGPAVVNNKLAKPKKEKRGLKPKQRKQRKAERI